MKKWPEKKKGARVSRWYDLEGNTSAVEHIKIFELRSAEPNALASNTGIEMGFLTPGSAFMSFPSASPSATRGARILDESFASINSWSHRNPLAFLPFLVSSPSGFSIFPSASVLCVSSHVFQGVVYLFTSRTCIHLVLVPDHSPASTEVNHLQQGDE